MLRQTYIDIHTRSSYSSLLFSFIFFFFSLVVEEKASNEREPCSYTTRHTRLQGYITYKLSMAEFYIYISIYLNEIGRCAEPEFVRV